MRSQSPALFRHLGPRPACAAMAFGLAACLALLWASSQLLLAGAGEDAASLAAAAFGIPPAVVDAHARDIACVAGCGAVTRITRSFAGVGFHRRLVTEVEASWPVATQPDTGDDSAALPCTLLLLESLPSGAYADAYELAGAARAGAPPARVFGEVNVERPAPECAPSVVAVLAPVNATAEAVADQAGARVLRASAHLSLPLHARYPAPAPPPASLSRVVLPPPRVLLRCSGDEQWRPATYAPHAAADSLVWQVPAGNLAHAPLVDVGSAAASIAGALVVLWRLYALPPAANDGS